MGNFECILAAKHDPAGQLIDDSKVNQWESVVHYRGIFRNLYKLSEESQRAANGKITKPTSDGPQLLVSCSPNFLNDSLQK